MTAMDDLSRVAASYDRTIEFGMKAVNLYRDPPDSITSHPNYEAFREASGCGSDSAAVRRFLDPRPGTRFLDIGCAVMSLVEEYTGRLILLKRPREEFEASLPGRFSVSEVDASRVMI